MSYSYQGKASFGGVQFGIEQDDGPSVQLPSEDQNLDITEVNYGGSVIIQDLGRAVTEFTVTVIIPAGSLGALRNQRTRTGTLTIAPGYSTSAYFKAMGNPRVHPQQGFLRVNCTWLV